MKTTIVTFLISLAGAISSHAQCEENAMLITSKTNLTDASGNPVGVKDEKTTLKISKAAILLNIDGVDRGELKIASQTCKWTTPYKDGKTVIKATMDDYHYTITIEGKAGKVNLRVVKLLSDDNILTMTADKFEKMN